jgi:hypothetical protein
LTVSDSDLFDMTWPAPPPGTTLASEGEAHEQLKLNLKQALNLQKQIMGFDLSPDLTASDKRLAADAANATVKAALTTDRTALKARQDNTLERVFLRVLFHARVMGRELSPKDLERLKSAPRAELEAALSPRSLAAYDRMEF